MSESPTAKHLITRLQRMLGHLGAKDRATVVETITAITELSVRLHEATHVERRPGYTLRKVEEDAHGVDSVR